MIKQECIGIPDMILLIMIFLFQKKIKAEIVLSPGGAYFANACAVQIKHGTKKLLNKTCAEEYGLLAKRIRSLKN